MDRAEQSFINVAVKTYHFAVVEYFVLKLFVALVQVVLIVEDLVA